MPIKSEKHNLLKMIELHRNKNQKDDGFQIRWLLMPLTFRTHKRIILIHLPYHLGPAPATNPGKSALGIAAVQIALHNFFYDRSKRGGLG